MWNLQKLVKSRTVWTVVVMFVIGGFQAVEPFMSPQVFLFVNGALTLVATHFKMKPSQDYKD